MGISLHTSSSTNLSSCLVTGPHSSTSLLTQEPATGTAAPPGPASISQISSTTCRQLVSWTVTFFSTCSWPHLVAVLSTQVKVSWVRHSWRPVVTLRQLVSTRTSHCSRNSVSHTTLASCWVVAATWVRHPPPTPAPCSPRDWGKARAQARVAARTRSCFCIMILSLISFCDLSSNVTFYYRSSEYSR